MRNDNFNLWDYCSECIPPTISKIYEAKSVGTPYCISDRIFPLPYGGEQTTIYLFWQIACAATSECPLSIQLKPLDSQADVVA